LPNICSTPAAPAIVKVPSAENGSLEAACVPVADAAPDDAADPLPLSICRSMASNDEAEFARLPAADAADVATLCAAALVPVTALWMMLLIDMTRPTPWCWAMHCNQGAKPLARKTGHMVPRTSADFAGFDLTKPGRKCRKKAVLF